ncbi:MAG: GntR family transcriptional regulator, partial [Betaproteobacteria bacterium]
MIKAASEGFVNPSLHKDEEEALSSEGSFHREKNNQPLAGAIDPSRADRLDAEAVGRGPVWAVIEQVIASDIAAGMYKPGEKLPSENALALRFGVNRHTVRQATSHLAR